MLAIRPTFSESWYRLAGLRAKLRGTAQISRQYYRGERWYVVRDPAGNQFHRLSDAAYRFVGLLDGTRTVQEAWDLVGGQLADDAPTQPEVIQILTHLYSANLIDADVSPDASVLLRRHKKLRERKLKGRLMSVMFPKIPLWDPDRFLRTWMPVVRLGFSKVGAIVWLLAVIGAIAYVAPDWQKLKSGASDAVAPGNWMWLWAVFVLIKLIHELGHAFACRRFGGECHELGVMFLVFIPTPYVDASTAWGFPSKWQRIFVGAAGMIVELFFAAVCAVIWKNTAPNTLPHQLAYNAMLVASVTTVIFNANPLLRYDGYYILSDWLEIPNLRQKSSEYAMGLIKRHVFRIRLQQPLPPLAQRAWLLSYAVTSTIYRTFVGIMIILVVTWQVPVLGVLMAIGGLITWLVVPVVKLVKYLSLEPELHRKRGRAWAFTGAVAAATVVAIGIIPFWVYVEEQGYVQAAVRAPLNPRSDGFVREVLAKDGQLVRKGDVIYVAANDELDAEIRKLEARRRGGEARVLQAGAVDQHQKRIEQASLDVIERNLADAKRRKDDLTLRAPIAGRVVAPKLGEMVGRFVPRGTELGQIVSMEQLEVRTTVQQRDFEIIAERGADMVRNVPLDEPDDARVQVRLAGDVATILPGRGLLLINSAQPEVPHATLTFAGGEQIATDPQDQNGTRPVVPQFEARVLLDNANQTYLPGQRATVRFRIDKKPLIWNWARRFWQLVQTHADDKWI